MDAAPEDVLNAPVGDTPAAQPEPEVTQEAELSAPSQPDARGAPTEEVRAGETEQREASADAEQESERESEQSGDKNFEQIGSAPLDLEQLPDFRGPDEFERPGRWVIDEIRKKLDTYSIVFVSSYDDTIRRGVVGRVAQENEHWKFKDANRRSSLESDNDANRGEQATGSKNFEISAERLTVPAILESKSPAQPGIVIVVDATTTDAMRAQSLDEKKQLQNAEDNLARRGLRILILCSDSTLPTWDAGGRVWEYREKWSIDSEDIKDLAARKQQFKTQFEEIVCRRCFDDTREWRKLLKRCIPERDMRQISTEATPLGVGLQEDLDFLIMRNLVEEVLKELENADECWDQYQRIYRGRNSSIEFDHHDIEPLIDRTVSINAVRAIATYHLPPPIYRLFTEQIRADKWGITQLEISKNVRLRHVSLREAVESLKRPRSEESIREAFEKLDPLAQMVRVVAAMLDGLTMSEFNEVMLVLTARRSWYRDTESGQLHVEPLGHATELVKLDHRELWRLHGDAAFRSCGLRVTVERRDGGKARVVSESPEAHSFGWRSRLESWSPLLVRELLTALRDVDELLFDRSDGVFEKILGLLEDEVERDTAQVEELLELLESGVQARPHARWRKASGAEWSRACWRSARTLAELVPAVSGRITTEKLLMGAVNGDSAIRVLRIAINLLGLGVKFDDFAVFEHILRNGGERTRPRVIEALSWRYRRSAGDVDAWKLFANWLGKRRREDSDWAAMLAKMFIDILLHSIYLSEDFDVDATSGRRKVEVHGWLGSTVVKLCEQSSELPPPLRWLIFSDFCEPPPDKFFRAYASVVILCLTPANTDEDKYLEQVLAEVDAHLHDRRRAGEIGRIEIFRELFTAALATIWEWKIGTSDASDSRFMTTIVGVVSSSDELQARTASTWPLLDIALQSLSQVGRPAALSANALEHPGRGMFAAAERLRTSIARFIADPPGAEDDH